MLCQFKEMRTSGGGTKNSDKGEGGVNNGAKICARPLCEDWYKRQKSMSRDNFL